MSKQALRLLMKSKHPLNDIYYYIQGHIRYRFYYSINWQWLIRKHIRDQIDYRIKLMNPKCYHSGQCIICGCATTYQQMANKTCGGKEYPPITYKNKWIRYVNNYKPIVEGEYMWLYDKEGITEVYKQVKSGYIQINPYDKINNTKD